MTNQPNYGPNDEAVRTHLTILQDIIRRMAANSASCKNWCIILVAAMLLARALATRTDAPAYTLLALAPTLLFYILDAYYLALEQSFRHSYNAFVAKLHRGELDITDLYAVRPGSPVARQMLVSLRSTAIWPFYALLALTIILVWRFDDIKTLAAGG